MNQKKFELNNYEQSYEDYWENVDFLFEATQRNQIKFDVFVKYAWEHDLDSDWFKGVVKVMAETEVLVIIGYSFPPFNREIDQHLFSKLNFDVLKKIVYQDPNANKEIIENLFEFPAKLKDKIIIEKEKENMKQFHIPNQHFITQPKNIDIR